MQQTPLGEGESKKKASKALKMMNFEDDELVNFDPDEYEINEVPLVLKPKAF